MKSSFSLQQKFVTEIIEQNFDLSCFDKQNSFLIVDNYFKENQYENQLSTYISAMKFNDYDNIFWIEASEKNKKLETVLLIIDKIFTYFQGMVSRDMQIIAIGGGICLDISSFCASIINRGCDLIIVPTTLLSMCDAGIGGKTGVNYKNLKNKIGSFYPAKKVIFDYRLLSTLSLQQLRDGYVELLKTILILDRDFFLSKSSFFESNLRFNIFKCAQFKLKLCSSDLNDRYNRQLLNLGHTFGHILESLSDFKVSHGQAVYLGILMSLKYSYHLKKLSYIQYKRLHNYFFSVCGKFIFKYEGENFHQKVKTLLLSDKKVISSTLTLILVTDASIEKIYLNKDTDRKQINDLIDFIYDNLQLSKKEITD